MPGDGRQHREVVRRRGQDVRGAHGLAPVETHGPAQHAGARPVEVARGRRVPPVREEEGMTLEQFLRWIAANNATVRVLNAELLGRPIKDLRVRVRRGSKEFQHGYSFLEEAVSATEQPVLTLRVTEIVHKLDRAIGDDA